jgi:hypothetical protein
MKRQTPFVLTLLVVFVASAAQSRADSDAFFCTSKGYLAYETRKGVTLALSTTRVESGEIRTKAWHLPRGRSDVIGTSRCIT